MASIIRQHPRKIIAGGAIIAFLASPYAPSLFRTPGVQSIEDRWSAGGGGRNHTPGGGTPLGKRDEVMGNQLAHEGMGSPKHQEKIGEQKPEVGYLWFLCFILWNYDVDEIWGQGDWLVGHGFEIHAQDGLGKIWIEHSLTVSEGEQIRQSVEQIHVWS
ncbi:MAG: hypothetical protein Q9224_000935 [Gallowayella concinna]